MRRGKLLEEIRIDMHRMHGEMSELREEVRGALEEARADRRFGYELLRRHEVVLTGALAELRDLRAESRAHTQALLRLLDRFEGGGPAPAT